jgi:hypothetical protein
LCYFGHLIRVHVLLHSEARFVIEKLSERKFKSSQTDVEHSLTECETGRVVLASSCMSLGPMDE